MKRIFLLLFLVPVFANGQADSINRVDSAGKKDGKWTLYYNSYFKVVDSSKAVYYCYTYFDHGVRTRTFCTWGEKKGTLHDSLAGEQKMMGNIKLLDGKYTLYDRQGRIFNVHVFNKGEAVWSKQYYPSGQLYLYSDYARKKKGQPYSYHWDVYDKKGNLKYSKEFCREPNGKWYIL